jgi:hypothetical protein
MKKILLALLCLFPSLALAQNPTCPTRPSGDSSNACANTAFVGTAVSTAQALAQFHFFIGNASGVAADTVLSGDCTYGAAGIVCTKTNGVAFATLATKASPVCSDLTNAATSCSTDTTNATNIGSGTLNTARLPSPFTSGTASGNTSKFATTTGTLTSGDCVKIDASGNFIDAAQTCGGTASVVRSYLAGNTLSGGGSQTLTITAGQATSDDQTTSMALGSTYTKTFAAWAVGSGNGGLDTGAIAGTTWYHVYIIERTDTQVVDVLISLSASAPTLPTNYTKQRRIGSIKTDATPNIISFFQNGDTFLWSTLPTLDLNGTANTTAALFTVQTPPGVRTEGIFNLSEQNNTGGGGGAAMLLSSPDVADTAPSNTASPLGTLTFNVGTGTIGGVQVRVWTNATPQIRHRESVTSANLAIQVQTLGWVDPRGRFN